MRALTTQAVQIDSTEVPLNADYFIYHARSKKPTVTKRLLAVMKRLQVVMGTDALRGAQWS